MCPAFLFLKQSLAGNLFQSKFLVISCRGLLGGCAGFSAGQWCQRPEGRIPNPWHPGCSSKPLKVSSGKGSPVKRRTLRLFLIAADSFIKRRPARSYMSKYGSLSRLFTQRPVFRYNVKIDEHAFLQQHLHSINTQHPHCINMM